MAQFEPDVQVGSIGALPGERSFETILYIDVLEHIEDDKTELARAANLLASRGRLIVLSPAHNYLFSEFDRAIGHFRRYNRRLIELIAPQDLKLRELFYLDSVGMLLSLGNRLLLRSPRPTLGQLAFWERCILPCSRVIASEGASVSRGGGDEIETGKKNAGGALRREQAFRLSPDKRKSQRPA